MVKINIPSQIGRAAYQIISKSGAPRLLRRSSAVVFCYHNIVPDELCNQVGDPSLHTGVSRFAEQLEWINSAFTVVPVQELTRRLKHGKPIAGLAALTFDDGYTGVIRHAVPVMRRAQVPFAIFPVTEALTKRSAFWWDILGELDRPQRNEYIGSLKGDANLIVKQNGAARQLPEDLLPATWAMLQSILGDDCTIGVHTVTHRNLASLSPDEVTWELTTARSNLIDKLGVMPRLVSYPYGRNNGIVQEATRNADFDGGFSLGFSLVKAGASQYNCPRIDVPAGISFTNFTCYASGVRLRAPSARAITAPHA